jgi:hypothetical protein
MRQAIVGCFLVLQIGCSSIAEPDSDSAPLHILILPHSAQIREGELLVCKVTFHNRGIDAIRVERPPADENLNLVWEVRKQDERDFSRIKTRWTTMNGCVFWPEAGFTIPAGESYVTFDSLFPAERSQPFFTTGVYEIRAAFDLAGQRIVSQPAEIVVTPILDAERDAVAAAADFLDVVLNFSPPDKDELTERERRLGPSQLKTSYQWLLALLAAETETDPRAQAQAAISQGDLRKQVPPVMAEALELRVVERLIRLKNWSAADRLLEQIATPSYDREQLDIIGNKE